MLKKKGMTILDVSKVTGISFGYLYKIKRGKGNPTMQTIGIIAKALKCTTKELM